MSTVRMRQQLGACALLVVTALALTALSSSSAMAFGDVCHRDVKARGTVQSNMNAARGSAIASWEAAAARRHGAAFGNWYYSGDRSIDCSWDSSGKRIQCSAIALPCGRKR